MSKFETLVESVSARLVREAAAEAKRAEAEAKPPTPPPAPPEWHEVRAAQAAEFVALSQKQFQSLIASDRYRAVCLLTAAHSAGKIKVEEFVAWGEFLKKFRPVGGAK